MHLLGAKSQRVPRDDEGAMARSAAVVFALRQLDGEVHLERLAILAWTAKGRSWGYVIHISWGYNIQIMGYRICTYILYRFNQQKVILWLKLEMGTS